jgi:hypothetical protein
MSRNSHLSLGCDAHRMLLALTGKGKKSDIDLQGSRQLT